MHRSGAETRNMGYGEDLQPQQSNSSTHTPFYRHDC